MGVPNPTHVQRLPLQGGIPEEVLTVLLPKTVGDPQSWEETRPITLSCTVLKWFSQLLLLRGGGRIQDDQPLQWAARGKQAWEARAWLGLLEAREVRDWGIR